MLNRLEEYQFLKFVKSNSLLGLGIRHHNLVRKLVSVAHAGHEFSFASMVESDSNYFAYQIDQASQG